MTTFILIVGIILVLGLLNFVMNKFFKASGILRLLILVGLTLILLGVYSLPYITISWSAILLLLAIILLFSFIIFFLSKFFTPSVVKVLVTLSVVFLLVCIFLVSYTTFNTDKENEKIVVKKTTKDKLFRPTEQLGFNSGRSMKELDSITAQANKSFTYAKDISPSDLPFINKRKRTDI